MFIRFFIMLVLVGAGIGGLFYWKMEQNKAAQAAMVEHKMPPFSVEVANARTETRIPSLNAIGSLVAMNGIELKSEAAGRIVQLNFESGTEISKNTLLVQLNDSEEQADLNALEAQLKLARLDYARDQTLIKQKSIAVSTLDTSRAQLEKAQADITKSRALIEKKRLFAPFAGRIGIRRVNKGEYVQVGQTVAALQSLDPLYVNFNLPEQNLPNLYLNQGIEVSLDAFPDKSFQAIITAIDAEVNAQTRNISVQATLKNPQHTLVPGMFAKVKVLLNQNSQVVTVPETAISYSLYGNVVFVVHQTPAEKSAKEAPPQLTVERRYVKPGQNQQGWVAILDGVKAGEQVVSAGGLKLRDGAAVMIKAPKPETAKKSAQES